MESNLIIELRKKRFSSSNSKFVPFSSPVHSYSRDAAPSDPATDKRKSILQKEKDFYLNPSNRPTFSNLSRYSSVCLLSKTWNNEYLSYLEGSFLGKKMPLVNSDLIYKESSDYSRCMKRAEDKYGLNEILRPELKPTDFVMLEEELMDYLISRFHGYKIKREVLKTTNSSPFLEYFPLKIKVIVLSRRDLNNINGLEKAFNSWRLLQVFSPMKFQQLKQEILEILRISQSTTQISLSFFRVWRSNLDVNSQFESLKQQILELGQSNTLDNRSLSLEAENAEFYTGKTLKELGIQDESLLILEMKTIKEEYWFLKVLEKKIGLKRNFQSFSNQNEDLSSENFDSSNSPSLRTLRRIAMNSYDFKEEALRYEQLFPEVKPQAKGLTGLLNLTNTCYMNSALQCLSHTSELRNYFLEKTYHQDVVKGDAAYAFAILLRRLWHEKTIFISPNFMKVLFQKHPQLSMYSKNEQHDSQEFLHTFIDVLSEDLKQNRVEKKKQNEKMVSWMGHWAGNSSFISDLFVGVLKNTVKCPECQTISNNFEPFLNLSLHFPVSSPKNQGSIVCFKDRIEEDPRALTFELGLLDSIPSVFKEKVYPTKDSQLQHKAFVLLYGNVACTAYESDHKSVRELISQNKPATIAIFESSEKMKIDEGVYSLIFSKNERDSKTYSFMDFFKLAKIGRKSGSAVVSSILSTYLARLLSTVGIFSFGKKYTIRIRLLDHETNISICEKCHKLDLCHCSLDFTNLNALENKYRFSNYKLFFEICFDWDSMSKLEQNAVTKLSENFKEFQLVLSNSLNKPSSKGKDSFTIYDFLKHFRDPEVLCSQNAWFCNKCKKNQRATTQLEVFSAPKVLIIHLKRFKNNRNIKTKINLKIIYPLENLDLKEYVVETLMPEELVERKLKGEEKYEKKSVVYDLYGVINHHGSSLSCGHYTAICKNAIDEKWYKFDDKIVYEVKENAVCNNDAYVLFYRRRGK